MTQAELAPFVPHPVGVPQPYRLGYLPARLPSVSAPDLVLGPALAAAKGQCRLLSRVSRSTPAGVWASGHDAGRPGNSHSWGVDETTERQNQLTSCNAILDQLFAANGDAYVIQRGERAQVGAIECEESAREADTRTCGAGPELPFCIECSVVPSRHVMQGGAVIQRVQVTGQCMGFCVTGSTPGRSARPSSGCSATPDDGHPNNTARGRSCVCGNRCSRCPP